jgi:Beta/Gamma crystallin
MARIRLYRDDEYKGGEVLVEGDVKDLQKEKGFGDVVSSVKVESGTFTLYQDKDHGGYSLTVCKTGGKDSNGNYPNKQWLAGRGDVISSVKRNSDNPSRRAIIFLLCARTPAQEAPNARLGATGDQRCSGDVVHRFPDRRDPHSGSMDAPPGPRAGNRSDRRAHRRPRRRHRRRHRGRVGPAGTAGRTDWSSLALPAAAGTLAAMVRKS